MTVEVPLNPFKTTTVKKSLLLHQRDPSNTKLTSLKLVLFRMFYCTTKAPILKSQTY